MRPTINPIHDDRLPPQNLEVERAVLGAILLDAECLHDVSLILAPDGSDFYRDVHATLYRRIQAIYQAGRPVDLLTVTEAMRVAGEFDDCGGLDFISEVANAAPHAANAAYHSQIVREKSILRRYLVALGDGLKDVYSNGYTSDELADRIERAVFAVRDRPASEGPKRIDVAALHAMDRLVAAADGEAPGVRTGFPMLDSMTGGFLPGQLVIVAARPSMGKTQACLEICDHVSRVSGKSALLVSLEMDYREIGERFLIARSGIDGTKCRTPASLSEDDLRRLGLAYDQSAGVTFSVDDTAALSATSIAALARRHKARHGLDLLVIDYLQLMSPEEARDSRQEQVAAMSRRLKTLARELAIPVVACSQLNRQVENRDGHRPRMSDLRESGAIENDAHAVILLHRPDYYDPLDQPGLCEWILAKNRGGPTGTVNLHYDRAAMRFRPWEDAAGEVPGELTNGRNGHF